jgi:hypothetical protein
VFDHAACPPGAHDRDPGTSIDDGAPVDEHGVLLCADCRAPLMYCQTINDYAHVDPAAPPCLLVSVPAMDLVVRIQREITRDVTAGIVPTRVSSLWQLHHYVDANTYGGLGDDNARVRTDTVVRVQAEVDRWLAAHGHRPTFTVRTPDYEITRVNAASLPDARRIAARIPHVRVVLGDRGGTVIVERTDLPGPGLRRARIRTGPHAGHLAIFDADRDLAGLTRWIHDGGAYFDYEVEEVCGAWMPFATRADRSPVVCEHPVDHQHLEHAARAADGTSRLTWKPANQI